MKTPQSLLAGRVAEALAQVAPDVVPDGPLIVPSQEARFGDYQCNLAMGLAKTLKSNPRALAARMVENLKVSDLCETPEIAGPGFINLRLSQSGLNGMLDTLSQATDHRLGVDAEESPETIVVDYSSPNVAKSMHVGHIRSTAIGDAIARMLRFQGHHVIADNHLGDWGKQFGVMIVGYRDSVDSEAFKTQPLAELERVYRIASAREESDPAYADRIRAELAKLQAGDEENRRLWNLFMDVSRQAFERIYQRLDAHFDTWHGESFYNPMLADTVQSLIDAGVAREDQGAIVIFFDNEPPTIIRKRDGAALYSTTDLAGIRYRVDQLHARRIIILTDRRQELHFRQIFDAARRWGYRDVALTHVAFGMILGDQGTPLKTREGDNVKLEALLDEAEERALALARENDRNKEMTEEQLQEIARVVGLGAVKYTDLSQNRTSDYAFSWERMLAMNGNTGPYLQYAFARVQSIFRRGSIDVNGVRGPVRVETEQERALGLHLVRFGEALVDALEDYRPNRMTVWLYQLAVAFSSFYEHCPVLDAPEPHRTSRLTLCRMTGEALQVGLGLLGIETLPQM